MNIGREIHVWQITTDQPEEVARRAEGCIDLQERQKASKFLTLELQKRFILRRAALRQVLAKYLDIRPIEVRFEYSSVGKPAISSGSSHDLQFNLSHSGDWSAVAVCATNRIGIDIERIRQVENSANIIEQFYSAEEKLTFSKVSGDQKDTVFLKTWTCKEAYLKATGNGLSIPLDRVRVSVPNASSPPQLIHLDGGDADLTNWSVIELAANPDLIGTVVVEGRVRPILERSLDFNTV